MTADSSIDFDGLIASLDRCSSVLAVKITSTVCSIPCPNHWMKPISGCCVVLTMEWSKMLDVF